MPWESLGELRMTGETGLIQQTEHPWAGEVTMPESPWRTPWRTPSGEDPYPHLLSQVIRLPAERKPFAFITETMESYEQTP